MTDDSKQNTLAARLTRIALFIALIVMAVIAVYWWRTMGVPNQRALPAPTMAREQTLATASVNSRSDSSQEKRPTTNSYQDGVLEKFTAILKEKKIEVCGLTDAEAAQFFARGEWRGFDGVNSALAEATGTFIRSNKPRDNALGLYLQLNQVEWSAREIEGSAYKPCAEGSDCRRNESTEASQRMREAATEPLVKLALAANDPAIYATAVYACQNRRSDTCAPISYAGWAKIDPDNAAVWLMIAADAAANKDVVARDAALKRAVSAKFFMPRVPSMSPVLEAEAVRRQSPPGQYSIGFALIDVAVLPSLELSNALATVCLRGERLDDSRNDACDKLASRLLEADESVMTSMMAIAVASKVGWQPSRLQRIRDEAAVALGLGSDLNNGENAFSCENLPKLNHFGRSLLSAGERAIAREHVAASGKSLSELADGYRKAYPALIK